VLYLLVLHPKHMAPAQQTAAVVAANGGVELKQIAVPKPGENQVLIKVVAVALNPIDCTSSLLSSMFACLTCPQGSLLQPNLLETWLEVTSLESLKNSVPALRLFARSGSALRPASSVVSFWHQLLLAPGLTGRNAPQPLARQTARFRSTSLRRQTSVCRSQTTGPLRTQLS
jgi:hypothetical protein